ncbi:MAG: restriction endonuclease subunit S [Epsilonproteobacteria bacterium]|nr:restriction endonuclease subunit S [Campylobacterota bacterium]
MYKPYPKYKESGVAWLGEVPEGWEVKRLKHIAKVNLSNVDKKSKDGEKEVLLCNYTDVYYNDFITSDMSFMKATAKDEQIKKFTLEAGDVIITKDSEGAEDIAISTYVPETLKGVICGYHLAQIKPRNFNGNYFFRAFNSSGIHDQFKISANGITRYAVGKDGISNAFFPVPSKEEQTQISNYLTQETKKIDTLIKKQQTLIELLKKKRQALISHAVTKGLDDSVAMKESGIAWLGEMPKHWEVTPLRYIGLLQNGISKGKDYFGSGFPFVNYGDIYKNGTLPFTIKGLAKSSKEDQNIYSVRKGDIFFTRTSETINDIGMASTCLETIEKATFSGFTIRFRQLKNVLNENFSKYYFRTGHSQAFFEKQLNLVTRASLGQDILKQLPVLIPPLKEQTQIANYLDQKTKQIDTLIEKSTKAIELLKERRVALVSAVVTGKVDVRGEV